MAVINKFALEGKDDFIGFTFNDRHSSEFRIVRVSGGSRYNEDMLPPPKDILIDAPGRDGLYYMGTKASQRNFNIQIAYDDMREKDFLAFKEWLSYPREAKLIFDEEPYKFYWARVNGSPRLTYICFNEEEGNPSSPRIYRGEGQIQFVAYQPWAESVSKIVTSLKGKYPPATIEQWFPTSGLFRTKQEIISNGLNFLAQNKNATTKLKNNGQMSTPFQFIFNFSVDSDTPYSQITLNENGKAHTLVLDTSIIKPLAGAGRGQYILYDSENRLLLGIKNAKVINEKLTYEIERDSNGDAVIYNGIIAAGDFFRIPVGDSTLAVSGRIIPQVLTGQGGTPSTPEGLGNIFYNYLYY